jgi:hypothetical protein
MRISLMAAGVLAAACSSSLGSELVINNSSGIDVYVAYCYRTAYDAGDFGMQRITQQTLVQGWYYVRAHSRQVLSVGNPAEVNEVRYMVRDSRGAFVDFRTPNGSHAPNGSIVVPRMLNFTMNRDDAVNGVNVNPSGEYQVTLRGVPAPGGTRDIFLRPGQDRSPYGFVMTNGYISDPKQVHVVNLQ